MDTPKLLENPNTVPYPINYDDRRLFSKVNFLIMRVIKRVTGQFKNAPYMVYLGAWTLKNFSEKRFFVKLLKNVQLRARASACTCVRVRVQFCV